MSMRNQNRSILYWGLQENKWLNSREEYIMYCHLCIVYGTHHLLELEFYSEGYFITVKSYLKCIGGTGKLFSTCNWITYLLFPCQIYCQPRMARSKPFSSFWKWWIFSWPMWRRPLIGPPRCWISITLISSWKAWKASTLNSPTIQNHLNRF